MATLRMSLAQNQWPAVSRQWSVTSSAAICRKLEAEEDSGPERMEGVYWPPITGHWPLLFYLFPLVGLKCISKE